MSPESASGELWGETEVAKRLFHALTSGFPLWVLVASLLALWEPAWFTWFTGPLIPIGLGLIMLGMGLTLELEDFKRVFEHPIPIGAGIALQYTIMPMLGWTLGYVFNLPTPFAVGLVLVSCCPGGTASNVISFLARANVALSVSMTSFSTLLAALMTPTLTALLAGSRVDVPALGLFKSTVQVVVLPVLGGLLLRRYLPGLTRRLVVISPFMAVVFITLIVASIIGAGKDSILHAGLRLLGAIFTLHAGGFLLGYVVSLFLLKEEIIARTISIEVGMQNSGLGVVLARQNFANPLVAIPSAISSLTHCLIGSFLAAVWSRKLPEQPPGAGFADTRREYDLATIPPHGNHR